MTGVIEPLIWDTDEENDGSDEENDGSDDEAYLLRKWSKNPIIVPKNNAARASVTFSLEDQFGK